MKNLNIVDLRNERAFPNKDYRFSTLEDRTNQAVLSRDAMGENPLHYYVNSSNNELIVANNICDIKDYVESNSGVFAWDRVRAVSNDTVLTINKNDPVSGNLEEDLQTTLDKSKLSDVDFSDINQAAARIRKSLEDSVSRRLSEVGDPKIGILLSGGLDSGSIAYLLSNSADKSRFAAYTLKVDENEKDIVRCREVAQTLGIELIEVKLTYENDSLSVTTQKYDSSRNLISETVIAQDLKLIDVVSESLRISGNPKKDNVLCAIAMYLIGKAISSEGIQTVFCGEGPNEMLNDYGFNPADCGYDTDNKGDVNFRESLTFGNKKIDLALGRGGLAKHATARMGKIFASYDIRLEAPYFDLETAQLMTNLPHTTSYDTIKQNLMLSMFSGTNFEQFIEGTAKDKFQDGSGVSRIFSAYDQRKLIDLFAEIYGVRKSGYL